ncbi:arylmalonate decarboxylase [Roseomonas sp. GC11]|uniref:maleate cis-trans isomerase family protein n=1 Tax=Roseomonas sp. GC11 TaxID=2950546 RepID=UPI00210E2D3F|nr:arylmalonate decarboxylase [Roseomonas sp. GC11]MCQ4159181.1 arylmalonate decarboxylase [Roseomonas sp. GC11]
MTDSLGWRRTFGVLVPSTNTSVQPEFDAMRPAGVTNHISRIRIPNIPLASDEDFGKLIELIVEAQDEALESVLSCEPDHIVLGISAETFWDGAAASQDLKKRLEDKAGLPVTMGADACHAALATLGVKRIGVITPYFPIGDRNVARFFEESGIAVPRIRGLSCESPVAIARVPAQTLVETVRAVDDDDVDAIVQVGTNLAFAATAAQVEIWLGKPVIAINTAIYWHALRSAGITDVVAGFGPLLARH